MIDWIKRLFGDRREPGEDTFGFIPLQDFEMTAAGRVKIGLQRNADDGFDPVYSDGSGVTECRSPVAFSRALLALTAQIVRFQNLAREQAGKKKAHRFILAQAQKLRDQRQHIEMIRYVPTGFALSTHAKLEMELELEGGR